MEKRIMKKLALFGLLLALSLILSAPLFAQRSAPHGGGSRMHAGGGGHSGGAATRSVLRSPGFAPGYSNYYSPASYGFGMPLGYTANPFPEGGNGGPMVIVSPPLVPDAGVNVVYVPSYMRESNGPSLAEIAAQLKTDRQPAKYIWRNVEPLLQPKEDSR
jgi:hypothetical protein